MRIRLTATLLCLSGVAHAGFCQRFNETKSSAYDTQTKSVHLAWRTDFPSNVPVADHAWKEPGVTFDDNWEGYIGAVLNEVRASGIKIEKNGLITMPANAPWWISPWMDYGESGRDSKNGLTKERAPKAGDLSPRSKNDYETWAIGWYNAEGAASLGEVFADHCNPQIPKHADGSRWTLRNDTVAFKFLFTSATETEIPYLKGSPVVKVVTSPGQTTDLRLIQVDVAVRDSRAKDTGWVFGTFVWQAPSKGDGLFDNLVPVGLMWGNDPGAYADSLSETIPDLKQSKLNPALAGVIWQGADQAWPQRPFLGFQGRLNGPADNWRSSCMACHAAAQFPRNAFLGAPPKVEITQDWPLDRIKRIFGPYFVNVQGGHLIDLKSDDAKPTSALPLDYSLQLQTSFIRICQACAAGDLSGPTPIVCNGMDGAITRATCPAPQSPASLKILKKMNTSTGNLNDVLPRQ